MAKFTRTAYAGGSLRDVVRDIANFAHLGSSMLSPQDLAQVYGDDLSSRKAKGRRRVRITLLVEPVQAPAKRKPGPARKRPVQQALPLDEATPSTCEEQDMGGNECPAGQCCREGICRRGPDTLIAGLAQAVDVIRAENKRRGATISGPGVRFEPREDLVVVGFSAVHGADGGAT